MASPGIRDRAHPKVCQSDAGHCVVMVMTCNKRLHYSMSNKYLYSDVRKQDDEEPTKLDPLHVCSLLAYLKHLLQGSKSFGVEESFCLPVHCLHSNTNSRFHGAT